MIKTVHRMRHLLLACCLLGLAPACKSKDKAPEISSEKVAPEPSEKPTVTCETAAAHIWEVRLGDKEHPIRPALIDTPAKLDKLRRDLVAEYVDGCRKQADPKLECVMKANTRSDLVSCR